MNRPPGPPCHAYPCPHRKTWVGPAWHSLVWDDRDMVWLAWCCVCGNHVYGFRGVDP